MPSIEFKYGEVMSGQSVANIGDDLRGITTGIFCEFEKMGEESRGKGFALNVAINKAFSCCVKNAIVMML